MEPLEPEETTRVGPGDQASPWLPFSLWEDQCIREAEEAESQFNSNLEANNHRLWIHFQASACSIAQLYKDRTQGLSLWLPFQVAASNVTTLYKECLESQKTLSELSLQCGMQRRNKELLSWLKKKKRNVIRREELMAFLSGKSTKNHSHHVSRSPRRSVQDSPGNQAANSVFASSRSPNPSLTFSCLSLSDSTTAVTANTACDAASTDLQPFRDAIALSTRTASATATLSSRKSNRSTPTSEELEELNAFMSEEFNRNIDSKKRSYSNNDVVMGSPTHKKPRYL